MTTLRIQHSVPDFDAWKQAFDADPMDRKAAGVRRYRVHRSMADPNLVSIDLDFDSVAQAEALVERLQRLWAGPGGAVMRNPVAWLFNTVDGDRNFPSQPPETPNA
ncbi:MAG TPA: hypothetical protein PK826_16075 [Anaerolineae bacterium]|nr:hypothetical protein [Anaerolineae bacterium]